MTPGQLPPLSSAFIEEARAFLAGRIRRTPLEASPGLSSVLGAPVRLKLESLQLTGSFKIRGALFRLSLLTDSEKRAGIATCSAGNHGRGIAYAARSLGIVPRIYVPSSVDESKLRGMTDLGAEVVRSRWPGYDDTEQWAMEEAARSGKVWISAFDDEAIMAGNGGTLALEILEDAPDTRGFVLPVGGGGMSAGLAFTVKERFPDAVIVGCNHEKSPALALSRERGEAVTRLPAIETTAGGIEGGIGAKPFEVLRTRVDRVALVSEKEILDAVRWTFANHQYAIEPSSAAAVAACLTGKAGRFDRPVAVVLSGRNVSLSTFSRILGAQPERAR
ncbi:MAG TPA: threonine/serine dehydratase [Thermoanaerobaculia bacterium]|nr:threonine/serine dehydratase [Thermoanaerobaculia bacterium]